MVYTMMISIDEEDLGIRAFHWESQDNYLEPKS